MNILQRVSALQIADYDREQLLQAMRQHFKNIQVDQLILPGMKVALKVNLLMKRNPDQFTTTHPQVVYAVIQCLKELGIKPEDMVLCDSPGGVYTQAALKGIYRETGMEQVCRETGVTLNYDVSSQEVYFKGSKVCRSFTIIQPLIDADCIIDICKSKTHCMTMLSGGVKNMFGSIPGLMKPHMHYRFPDVEDFADMLLDLCSGVAPALVVCDGVQAMMGDGPSSGVRCDMGYTLVSRSPYALDIALCNLMGFDTGRVPTVKQSIKRDMVLPKIEVVGDDLIPVQNFLQPQSKGIDFTNFVPRFLRRPARNFMRAVLTPRPVVNRDMCVGCGKCAESCPQKTIEIVQKKAVIHYNKCQKCYCCHEMCPIHAIDVRKNIITKR